MSRRRDIFNIVSAEVKDQTKISNLEKQLTLGASLTETLKGESILHHALNTSGTDLWKWLLEKEPTLLWKINNAKATPFFSALKHANSTAIQFFLNRSDRKDSINYIIPEIGLTANYFAAFSGNMQLYKAIRKECAHTGFDAKFTDECVRFVFDQMLTDKHIEIAKSISEDFKIDVQKKNPKGFTPVHVSVMNESLIAFKFLVVECKADYFAVDDAENNILHHAVMKNNFNFVKFFEPSYQVLNKPNQNGFYPIHVAASNGNINLIDYFLKKNRDDISLRLNNDSQGHILHIATNQGHEALVRFLVKNYSMNPLEPDAQFNSCLHFAVRQNAISLINYFFDELKINPRNAIFNNGDTLQHVAARFGRLEMAHLIDKKDHEIVHIKNSQGFYPVHLAADTGNIDLVSFFLDRCPEKTASHIVENKDGDNILHRAIRNNDLNLVKVLAERYQFNLNKMNLNGWAPIHLAANMGHDAILEYLFNQPQVDKAAKLNGANALFCALRGKRFSTIQFLVKGQKNQTFDLSEPLFSIVVSQESDQDKIGLISCLMDLGASLKVKFQGSTLLHVACAKGSPELVNWLITKEPSLFFEKDREGRNCVFYALPANNIGVIDFLRQHPQFLELINQTASDPKCTANFYAAVSGNLALLKQIQSECKLTGFTADHKIEQIIEAVIRVLDIQNFEMADYLFETYKIDPNSLHTNYSNVTMPIVHWVTLSNSVKYLVEKYKVDIKTCDSEGNTLLHHAARRNQVLVLKLCIEEYKLDPCAWNAKGLAPIHIAADRGFVETIDYLVKSRGVNSNLVTKNDYSQNILHIAIRKGHQKLVKFLLEQLGMNPRVVDSEGNSALHYSAVRNQSGLINYLVKTLNMDPLEVGTKTGHNILHLTVMGNFRLLMADLIYNFPQLLMSKTQKGEHAIHLAARLGNIDIVRQFLNQYKIDKDIAVLDELGDSILHIAIRSNQLSLVKVLMEEYDMGVDTPNKKGEYPIHIAAKLGHTELLKYLIAQPDVDLFGRSDGASILTLAIFNKHKETVDFILANTPLTFIAPLVDVLKSKSKDQEKISQLKVLLSLGASLDDKLEVAGVLHEACYNSGPELLGWLLHQSPKLLFSTSSAGTNAFFYALKFNNQAAIDFFSALSNFNDLLNHANFDGYTANYFAALSGDISLLEKVLEKTSGKDFRVNNHLRGVREAFNSAIVDNKVAMANYLINRYKVNPLAINEDGKSALHKAASHGHKEAFLFLLECKADKNLKTKPPASGFNILHLACQYKQFEIVKLCIEELQMNPLEFTNSGWLPIHLAAGSGSIEILDYLRKVAPDSISRLSKNNKSQGILHCAVAYNHWKMAKYIKEVVKPVWHTQDQQGNTLLHLTNDKRIAKYFFNSVSHCPNNNGFYPIHVAVERGNKDLVRLYLNEFKIDKELVTHNERGETILHRAIMRKNLDLFRMLVDEYKMDCTTRSLKGNSPTTLAAINGFAAGLKILLGQLKIYKYQQSQGRNVLHDAVCAKNFSMVKLLVEEYQMDPSSVAENGWTPMLMAAERGDMQAVFYFLDHCKVDPYQEAKNKWGQNIINTAIRNNHVELVKALIRKEQSLETKLEQKDKQGWYPLHDAVELDCLSSILYLLQKNVSEIVDNNGMTPFIYALENKKFRPALALYRHQTALLSDRLGSFLTTLKPLEKNKFVRCMLTHSLNCNTSPRESLTEIAAEIDKRFRYKTAVDDLTIATINEHNQFLNTSKTRYIEIYLIENFCKAFVGLKISGKKSQSLKFWSLPIQMIKNILSFISDVDLPKTNLSILFQSFHGTHSELLFWKAVNADGMEKINGKASKESKSLDKASSASAELVSKKIETAETQNSDNSNNGRSPDGEPPLKKPRTLNSGSTTS